MLPVAIRPPTDFLIVVNHLAFLRLTSQCRNLANHAKLIGLGTNSLAKRGMSCSLVN